MAGGGTSFRSLILRKTPFARLQNLSLQRAESSHMQLRGSLTDTIQAIAPRPAILGENGPLIVRLAATPAEIEAAQRLRFKVFTEMRTGTEDALGVDRDAFDGHCDHLLVIDRSVEGSFEKALVGTYRLLSPESAEAASGCYGADEFVLFGLTTRHSGRRFLELGRSCVLPAYRSKRTIDLLWQGIWAYCLAKRIDTMVGCASFQGTNPAAHAEALSFLAHHAPAEGDFACPARSTRGVCMDMMPVEAIVKKRALAGMPPLVKGYLRLGAMFGHEAVIDHDFGTVDVLTILPVERIASRYLTHFTPKARQAAEILAA